MKMTFTVPLIGFIKVPEVPHQLPQCWAQPAQVVQVVQVVQKLINLHFPPLHCSPENHKL